MSDNRTPCIVIARDRVSLARRCVASLEERGAGLLDIHIVDHGSTWKPMLSWLETTPYQVHLRGDRSPRELWSWDGLVAIVGDGPYLVTDPDVIFDDACPADWLDALSAELAEPMDDVVKVGMSLRVDDLPGTPMGDAAREWEAPFWRVRSSSGFAWRAPVDTTLALYRPLRAIYTYAIAPASRLDAPYRIRHLPWYAWWSDGSGESDEDEYYRAHARPGATHWTSWIGARSS